MKRTAGFAALATLGLPIVAEDLTLAGGRILHDVAYAEANPASVLVNAREAVRDRKSPQVTLHVRRAGVGSHRMRPRPARAGTTCTQR